MGMRPDSMERWGVVAILKESARLLHNYPRLFLPFFLAFYLTASIVGIYQLLFLTPSAPPLSSGAGFIMRTITIDHDQRGEVVSVGPTAVSMTLSLLVYALGTIGLGAVAYTVAYIYSNEEESDNISIIKKVFKLLPGAFLRMFVTDLWTFLPMLVLYLFSVFLAFLVYTILRLSNPVLVPLLAVIPFFTGVLFITIMFAFSQFIAVLEPGNYGREALKRSFKLVKTGRAGTVVAVLLVGGTFSVVLMLSMQKLAAGSLPLWEEIVFGAFVAVVNAGYSVYFGVVSAVMYFVYTAKLNAVVSSIPEFHVASPKNPYRPLVPGTSIEEP